MELAIVSLTAIGAIVFFMATIAGISNSFVSELTKQDDYLFTPNSASLEVADSSLHGSAVQSGVVFILRKVGKIQF